MKIRRKQIFKHWGVVVGALLTVGVGLAFYQFKAVLAVVHTSYNLLFTRRDPIYPKDVLMVYMDDDSHERLNQRFDAAWDRRLHTRLVERLTAAGSRAVVFDVVFSDPSRDQSVDEAFGRALLANGNVVLAADTVPAGYGVNLVNIKQTMLPTEVLRDAAAQIGSAELKPSPDLVVRAHFHGGSEDLLPSMSWATATLLKAEVTKHEEQRFRDRWINYYGPAGTLPSISYHRALDTNATPDSMFQGKVVFVGARLFTKFAGDRKDEFRSPYAFLHTSQPFIPGVEIQATQFLNLIRGDWLGRWPAPVERTVLILFGILLGAGLVVLRPKIAVGAALGAVLLAGLVSNFGFVQHNGWFPWLILMLQAAVALAWAISFNSFRAIRIFKMCKMRFAWIKARLFI